MSGTRTRSRTAASLGRHRLIAARPVPPVALLWACSFAQALVLPLWVMSKGSGISVCDLLAVMAEGLSLAEGAQRSCRFATARNTLRTTVCGSTVDVISAKQCERWAVGSTPVAAHALAWRTASVHCGGRLGGARVAAKCDACPPMAPMRRFVCPPRHDAVQDVARDSPAKYWRLPSARADGMCPPPPAARPMAVRRGRPHGMRRVLSPNGEPPSTRRSVVRRPRGRRGRASNRC